MIVFQKRTMSGLSLPSSSVEHQKASTVFEANIFMQNNPDDAQDRFHHPQPDRDAFSVELTHGACANVGSKRVHLDRQLHLDSSFVRKCQRRVSWMSSDVTPHHMKYICSMHEQCQESPRGYCDHRPSVVEVVHHQHPQKHYVHW
jgi:hypothetical protein